MPRQCNALCCWSVVRFSVPGLECCEDGLAGSQSSSKLAAKVTWENKAEQATGSWPLASGVSHQPSRVRQARGRPGSGRQDKTRQAIRLDGTREVGRGGRVRWCRSGIDWGVSGKGEDRSLVRGTVVFRVQCEVRKRGRARRQAEQEQEQERSRQSAGCTCCTMSKLWGPNLPDLESSRSDCLSGRAQTLRLRSRGDS